MGGANFPGFSTSYQAPTQNLALTETHIFSATTTNEFRPSFNRTNVSYPLDPANPLGMTMPVYTIGGGITAIGVSTSFPQGRLVNNYGSSHPSVSAAKSLTAAPPGTPTSRTSRTISAAPAARSTGISAAPATIPISPARPTSPRTAGAPPRT